jgi:hypothetical protein
MLRTIGLATVFTLVSAAAEAGCSASRWGFNWGAASTLYLWSTGGSDCGTAVTNTNNTTEIHSYRMTKRPQNGTAVANAKVIGYKPKPGFKGDDSFEFIIHGRYDGRPVQAPVRVEVKVN